MRIRSIQLKIALLASVCVVAASSALVGYSIVSATNSKTFVGEHVGTLTEDSTKNQLKTLALAQATRVARNAVHAMQQIAKSSGEISNIFGVIEESAREQSVGIQEINTAVNTIDQGTQQNAAMVEQSTAASHSLAGEAVSLNRLIAQFNLETQSESKRSVRLASNNPRPLPSPAKALGRKVANAFGGSAEPSWKEF